MPGHVTLVEKPCLDRGIRQRLTALGQCLHPIQVAQGEIPMWAGAKEQAKIIRQAPAIPPGALGEVVQGNRPIQVIVDVLAG